MHFQNVTFADFGLFLPASDPRNGNNYDGHIHLVAQESQSANDLHVRHSISVILSTLGSDGIFSTYGWFPTNGVIGSFSWPRLFLFGRNLSQYEWHPSVKDTPVPVLRKFDIKFDF